MEARLTADFVEFTSGAHGATRVLKPGTARRFSFPSPQRGEGAFPRFDRGKAGEGAMSIEVAGSTDYASPWPIREKQRLILKLLIGPHRRASELPIWRSIPATTSSITITDYAIAVRAHLLSVIRYFFSGAARCLINLSSSSLCCAIRFALRSSSSAPEMAASCSISNPGYACCG